MSNRRILITGGTGQVGTELLRRTWPEDFKLIAPTRQELDLSDCESVEQYILKGEFSAVINSGAYTTVDKAESDVLTAWKVNALAPAAMAVASKKCGIPIIHVSTDYVFDGRKESPYLEDDPVAPLGVYGASKEAGEQAVRTGNPKHIILRTAWVFSPHGVNFVKTMLRLAAERKELRVVNDQKGSPTTAKDISEVIKTILLQQISESRSPTGTYHFVNAGTTTWYDFAQEIFMALSQVGASVPLLRPIASDEYPTPARRPINSTLDSQKLGRDFGIQPRDWLHALREVLGCLLEGTPREGSDRLK